MEGLMKNIAKDSLDLAAAQELLVIRYLFLTDGAAFLQFLNNRITKHPTSATQYASIYGPVLQMQPNGKLGFMEHEARRRMLIEESIAQSKMPNVFN